MKRLTLPPKHLRYVALIALAVLAGVIVYAFSKHPVQLREGGIAIASISSKPAAELPASTLAPAVSAQSALASSCAENGSDKLLLVSISQQHLWACDGVALVKDTVATTGASNAPKGIDDSTPTGTWHIYSKQTNRYLDGCDVNSCWHDYVQYWLPFDDSIGFHDASWQTFPFGSSQYQTDGSHGCVHLPTDFIAWLYTWAPVGTTVTVVA